MLSLKQFLILSLSPFVVVLPYSTKAWSQSSLSGSAAESFSRIFESREQTARRDILNMAAKSALDVAPVLQSFISIETRNRAVESFLHWNSFALQTSGRDHVFIAKDPNAKCKEPLTYEQLGPHRASRAMAIVHIAMFEAVNAVTQKYNGLTTIAPIAVQPSDKELFLSIAIAYAAHDTLAALYKNQASTLIDPELSRIVPQLSTGNPQQQIIDSAREVGKDAAMKVLELRKGDGANYPNGKPVIEPVLLADPDCGGGEPIFTPKGQDARIWHQDPVSRLNVALGAEWPKVKPFALTSGKQFRLPPIDITSSGFQPQVAELLSLGGIGESERGPKSSTIRTPTESMMGVFWGYDGVPSLCAPPTLYNQVIRALLKNDKSRVDDIEFVSRIFALANIAMADAGIAAWDSKFEHQVARPVTYIRNGDGGPTDGAACLPSDANCTKACSTNPDAKWCPLGAPATNGRGPNFTPPFPAYPSGHATFGGAIFQVLRTAWPDNTAFSFISDEFNGENKPADSIDSRPKLPQSWASLSDAEQENARSRIWLGIHWQADADAGIAQGHCVANYVVGNLLLPKGQGPNPSPICSYTPVQ